MARSRKPNYGFHITTPIAAVILLLIVFISLGYFFIETIPGMPPDNSAVLAEMNKHRETWREQQPPGYRYVVDRDCDCASETNRPYVVTEVAGERKAAFPIPVEAEDGRQLDAPEEPIWLDDLFVLITSADIQNQAVSARFHPEFGFPTEINIRQNSTAADTIAVYEIRDFEILEYR